MAEIFDIPAGDESHCYYIALNIKTKRNKKLWQTLM